MVSVSGLRFLLLQGEQRQTLITLNLLSSGDGDPSKLKPLSLAANPTRATDSGVDNRSGPLLHLTVGVLLRLLVNLLPDLSKCCLLQEKLNVVRKNPKQILIFSTFREHFVL